MKTTLKGLIHNRFYNRTDPIVYDVSNIIFVNEDTLDHLLIPSSKRKFKSKVCITYCEL